MERKNSLEQFLNDDFELEEIIQSVKKKYCTQQRL